MDADSCFYASSFCGALCIDFSYRLPVELDAMGAVHDAVTDCIGDCGISDDLVPPVDGNLRDTEKRMQALHFLSML
jgi:uncharacterized membrane protein